MTDGFQFFQDAMIYGAVLGVLLALLVGRG